MSKTYYPSLNGLRAISILLVIFHHLRLKSDAFVYLYKIIPSPYLLNFLQDGQLGVNIFFVISGFLITSILLNEEAATNTISLKNFYGRRMLRIFPAYYFLLFVYFILQLFHVIYISNISWLTAITYTKYFNWWLDWYTAHAWSLSIEEHFYIFWPLIFLQGPRFRKNFAWAIIIAVPFIRVFAYLHPLLWLNDYTIFVRGDAIATGCLFALYKDRILEKFSTAWRLLFFSAILCLLLLPFLYSITSGTKWQLIFIPLGITHGSVANFLVAVLLFYSVFGPKRIWFKLLNTALLNYIGLLSYSLYLWQQLFLSGSSYWLMKFPQCLACIGVMALFSYYIIEKPFNRLKAKFFKDKNTVPQKNERVAKSTSS
jgi:peptidoglycan/LPS O-acetylase OafA/YrhL